MTRPETLKLFPQSLNEFILIRVFGSQTTNAHSNQGKEKNQNQNGRSLFYSFQLFIVQKIFEIIMLILLQYKGGVWRMLFGQ